MDTPPDQFCYRRSEDFIARRIADETVLVPIRQRLGDLESIYTLNEVATFIWELLAKPVSVAAIASAVAQAFAGDPKQIREDVGEYLGQLLTLQAVRPIDEQPEGREAAPPRGAP